MFDAQPPPGKQLPPQFFFQRLNLAAQPLLGDVQPAAGLGKAAVLIQGQKRFDCPHLHRHVPPFLVL